MNALTELMATLSSQTIILVTLGIISLSILMVVYCIRKQNVLRSQLNKLSDDLRSANRGAIGMGQQILVLEKQLQQMSNHAQTTNKKSKDKPVESFDINTLAGIDDNSSSSESTNVAVEHSPMSNESKTVKNDANDKLGLARELLAKGKDLTDVASTCELSFAEVSLLRALNSSNSLSPKRPQAH